MVISCDMTENKETEQNDTVVYEIGFHMLSSLTEEELETAIDNLRKTITNHGGSFVSEGNTELIDLAYTMDINEGGKHTKYDKAYFGWIKFEMEPAKMVEMKAEVLDLDKNLLRYLLIKTVKEETRAQMQEATMHTLEDVKVTGTLEKKQDKETEKQGEVISEEEIDKAVEELITKEE